MAWEQLLDIKRIAAQEAAEAAALPPLSCPHDGEPLSQATDGGLYCRFDGWRP